MRMAKGRTRTVRVLLTGFGRFGPFKRNPTEELVRSYDFRNLGLPPGIKVRLKAVVLPVHTEAFEVLEERVQGRRFDLIIHLGLHSKARRIRIERRARNLMNFRKPDVRGNLVRNARILPDGPGFLYSNLPLKAIVQDLKMSGPSFEVSDNAGSYICNQLFYRSLHKNRRDGTMVGFIHVLRPRLFSKRRSVEILDSVLRTCINQLVGGP